MQCPYLVGPRVYLRPLDPDADGRLTLPWWNDQDVTRFTSRYRPVTAEQHAEHLRRVAADEKVITAVIVERAGDRAIGAVSLFEIDWRNRHAQFGIVIGAKDCWDKGYGTEATRLLVSHGFAVLNLNRAWLVVFEPNERARHVYEKLGFKTEGRLRQALFRDGRYWDAFVMGVLRDEWPGEPPG